MAKSSSWDRPHLTGPQGPKGPVRISNAFGPVDRLADTSKGERGARYDKSGRRRKPSEASVRSTNQEMAKRRRKTSGRVGKLSGVGRKTPPKPA